MFSASCRHRWRKSFEIVIIIIYCGKFYNALSFSLFPFLLKYATIPHSEIYGALAQLGARHTGSVEVTGSSPVCSILYCWLLYEYTAAYFYPCMLLLLHTSAILPRVISDGRLTPTTVSDLFHAACRAWSHLTSEYKCACRRRFFLSQNAIFCKRKKPL